MIDIGNSRIKGAAFESDGRLSSAGQRIFAAGAWNELYRDLTNHDARNLLYSTVAKVPTSLFLHQLRAEGRRVFALDHHSPLPFVNHYETPETLGKDRLAAVAGAVALHPGLSCLVIDAGTCITTDLVTDGANYQGGSISPGVNMRLAAMHERTARLPRVEPPTEEQALSPLGRSTEQALLGGGVVGSVAELEGVYQRLGGSRRIDRVLLTGGDGPLLSRLLEIPHEYLPHLVLVGLNKILSLHAEAIV